MARRAATKNVPAPAKRAPATKKGRARAGKPAEEIDAAADPSASSSGRTQRPKSDGEPRAVEELRRELAAAHARIAELEQRQSEVLNRIDWILDSLHTAMKPLARR